MQCVFCICPPQEDVGTVGTAHWESTVVKENNSKLIKAKGDVHSDNDSNDGGETMAAGPRQQDDSGKTTAARPRWQESNGDEEERSQQLI